MNYKQLFRKIEKTFRVIASEKIFLKNELLTAWKDYILPNIPL